MFNCTYIIFLVFLSSAYPSWRLYGPIEIFFRMITRVYAIGSRIYRSIRDIATVIPKTWALKLCYRYILWDTFMIYWLWNLLFLDIVCRFDLSAFSLWSRIVSLAPFNIVITISGCKT